MKFDFDKVIDRRGTFSKWDWRDYVLELGWTTRYDDDTIPLFTADMDFQCAPSIKEALQKVVDHNIYGYTIIDDTNKKPYVDAVCSWFERRHGWKFDSECVYYVQGTMKGIVNALNAVTKPGDSVLLTMPIYGPFQIVSNLDERKMVNSQLINNDGYYTIDWEDFEEKVKREDVTAFLLCNPHNPTGRVWTEDELKKIHTLCIENDVVVISDEVHCDIVRKGVKYIPMAKASGGKGVITCTGLGKTFNIAGLHPSNVIITDTELLEKYKKVMPPEQPSPFVVAAIIGAYTGGDEWVDEVNEYIDANIDWAIAFIKEKMPEVKVWRPEGTYILWMDFRGYGIDPAEISRKIAEGANVLLEHGEVFDPVEGPGFERLCTPSPRVILQEALERIAKEFN